MLIRSVESASEAKRPSRRTLLRRVSFFQELGDAELDAISQRIVEKRYSAGEILFQEGQPAIGLFLLMEGRIKITKTSSSGREVMLTLLTAPSGVAEVTMFDREPYPASAVAIEEVTAFYVDGKDFRQLCHGHPAIAWQLLQVVGRRLRELVATIEMISFGSVRQRLAAQLLEFPEDGFTLPFTHQEMASRVGTVREVVTRNLSRFQAEGLIRIRGREIAVLDREGLRREAETEL
jgi:CRP/FNR family transcriptional regulator